MKSYDEVQTNDCFPIFLNLFCDNALIYINAYQYSAAFHANVPFLFPLKTSENI